MCVLEPEELGLLRKGWSSMTDLEGAWADPLHGPEHFPCHDFPGIPCRSWLPVACALCAHNALDLLSSDLAALRRVQCLPLPGCNAQGRLPTGDQVLLTRTWPEEENDGAWFSGLHRAGPQKPLLPVWLEKLQSPP